ncbi:hypothetical protein [Marinagarivorans algicola]|uniref:hypothetical protein n=1 Tax=Marinagarivorans algicola TaxID=1513270 RepID=UPI0006B8CEE6|nr:hypothetical protein [Marinagarivorans algicola]
MAAGLSFTLKDNYSIKMWNPEITTGSESAKSLTGEYFFSVIYSLYKQEKSEVESVAKMATRIANKLSKDIQRLTGEILSLIEISKLKKSEHIFTVDFSVSNDKKISFSPSPQSGICQQNALFLKMFILFDQYISLLNESRVMTIISDKEFYTQRKLIQTKIRKIMERYNEIIKKFHKDRKAKNDE